MSRDGPIKHEDACENLRTQISHIVNAFEQVFQALEGDKVTLSVALYLATYFDQNKSCKNYYLQHRCPHLNKFVNNTYSKLLYSV